MEITKEVNPRFEPFLFDWDYREYLLVGGYGSSKSYHVALKLVLKCLEEKRKILVVREVYDTIRESCFDLFLEILADLDLLEYNSGKRQSKRVRYKTSPMQLHFPNGSKVIFKGMDKPGKLKSINGVSIVWLEEASEIKYAGYKELKGRLRHPSLSLHFILSTNPVGTENWVYQHFFKRTNDDGSVTTVLDDQRLYSKHTIVRNGVYYHHSVVDDNLFVPKSYVKTLDDMQAYDPDLYRVARLGQFGLNGVRVLPQFQVASSHAEVMRAVQGIPSRFKFTGFDFGFETSYNAVIRMAVDDKEKVLYIYWEYYKNHMTDDQTATELAALGLQGEQIVADNADPKAIQYYRQMGFTIRGCHKWAGSRLANTKKVKRFKRIVCSPDCINTVRELSTLTYAKDQKDNLKYDEFNIDPHTFSAIWYALDNYTVADVKEELRNSRKGAV
jgi:phage terminase large subunit